MATAILELFPETKLGHGPATDAGFFYDVYRETPFSDEDLAAIEKRMAEVVARDEKFVRVEESRDKGLTDYSAQGEFMKVHFIEKFTKIGDEISLYKNGGFTDFCRGPHVPSTGRVKSFKVMSVAGAYWLGDEKTQQLQRIYGTAFFNAKDLDAHFKRLEEIKARDHRVLGKQLDLYSIQEVAGSGLIFWHPKGGLIRKTMEDWMRDECVRRGYELVYTPHIMRREMWKISGHEENYGENMYPAMELDDAEYRLKPMNCPGHILIYKNSPKSYRDLPVRYAELGNVYRYERSGTMHGLLRVRGFTQDDAHIFCTPGQIEDEVAACIDFAESVLKTFGFEEFKVELSTWDPADKKFIGSAEKWDGAVGSLTRSAEDAGAHRPGLVLHAFLFDAARNHQRNDVRADRLRADRGRFRRAEGTFVRIDQGGGGGRRGDLRDPDAVDRRQVLGRAGDGRRGDHPVLPAVAGQQPGQVDPLPSRLAQVGVWRVRGELRCARLSGRAAGH